MASSISSAARFQSKRFDPEAIYIRRFVPELSRVPDAKIHEPWTMTPDEQRASRCRIGDDYPAPIVEHQAARAATLARYAAVKGRGAPSAR